MSENKNHDTKNVESTERRSFMKKGALATGALALGLGSAGTSAAQENEALVYTYAYHPGVQFRVENTLEQTTVIQLLQLPGGGNVPEISQPDDYSGWVIRYNLGNGGAAITTVMFSQNANLSADDQGQFSGDATIFSSELNLLSTTLQTGGGGGGGNTTTTTQGNGGGGNNSSA
ncbi:twin-arginine translocation signal domain-containing protein [Haladaptatus cibarius]|uniref:twin-arginine translocation signal domain-containing protein n=1 Tax=Haladaptatus cibarius TaxID=453847 RepID=UPI0006791A12|nr:twin-arginine translocation signal domain-containing protein [Haladaptatus cibarius]